MSARSLVIMFVVLGLGDLHARAEFKAGAAAVDITPTKLPVLVNGGFFSRSVNGCNLLIALGCAV